MTEKALSKLKNHRVSYLNGDAGPLAIGAMLYHAQGAQAKSQDCIERYIACCYMLFDHKVAYTILFLIEIKYGGTVELHGETTRVPHVYKFH